VLGSKSRARQDEATGMSHIGTPSHGATRLPALKVVVVGSRLVRIPTPDVIGDRINIFTGRPRRMAPSILRAEDWATVSRSSFLGQPLGVWPVRTRLGRGAARDHGDLGMRRITSLEWLQDILYSRGALVLAHFLQHSSTMVRRARKKRQQKDATGLEAPRVRKVVRHAKNWAQCGLEVILELLELVRH